VIPKRYRGAVFILVQADGSNSVDEFPNDGNNIFRQGAERGAAGAVGSGDLGVVRLTQAFDDSTIQVRFTSGQTWESGDRCQHMGGHGSGSRADRIAAQRQQGRRAA